jgi:sialate O-acetylesterase
MSNLFRYSILACVIAVSARANVTLPALLTDHMVIQRNQPVHVWGNADPGEAVTVTFRDATREGAADDLGHWSLYLPPGGAGGPFQMVVKGANTIVLSDVLVGDVRVASGQSNMEFPLERANNGAVEVAAANFPLIRLFHVERKVADDPASDVAAKPWTTCTPASAAHFSAVAQFFARDLQQHVPAPIGLIESDWGGTPLEAWTSMRALSADAGLMPVFAAWSRLSEDTPKTLLRNAKEWRDAEARAKAAGSPAPGRPWMNNMADSWMPAGLYNGMIAPLTQFAIRGVIWYQGESNASPDRAGIYARLFQAMITDWRRAWGEGDFPFLFVQLPNFKAGPDGRWPELREAQLQTLALRKTGMAITIDIGDPNNIHPTDKLDVGRRLSLAARAIAYGEKIEYSGPIVREARPEGASIRVWFDHAASGLVARGGVLSGFEIAGSDGKFVPADALIVDRTVVVSSAAVSRPVYVRYGWSDNPACNLYNADGLPASPFRVR